MSDALSHRRSPAPGRAAGPTHPGPARCRKARACWETPADIGSPVSDTVLGGDREVLAPRAHGLQRLRGRPRPLCRGPFLPRLSATPLGLRPAAPQPPSFPCSTRFLLHRRPFPSIPCVLRPPPPADTPAVLPTLRRGPRAPPREPCPRWAPTVDPSPPQPSDFATPDAPRSPPTAPWAVPHSPELLGTWDRGRPIPPGALLRASPGSARPPRLSDAVRGPLHARLPCPLRPRPRDTARLAPQCPRPPPGSQWTRSPWPGCVLPPGLGALCGPSRHPTPRPLVCTCTRRGPALRPPGGPHAVPRPTGQDLLKGSTQARPGGTPVSRLGLVFLSRRDPRRPSELDLSPQHSGTDPGRVFAAPGGGWECSWRPPRVLESQAGQDGRQSLREPPPSAPQREACLGLSALLPPRPPEGTDPLGALSWEAPVVRSSGPRSRSVGNTRGCSYHRLVCRWHLPHAPLEGAGSLAGGGPREGTPRPRRATRVGGRGRDSPARLQGPAGGGGGQCGDCEHQRNEENFNECRWENTLDLCGRPWTSSRRSWDAALLLRRPAAPGPQLTLAWPGGERRAPSTEALLLDRRRSADLGARDLGSGAGLPTAASSAEMQRPGVGGRGRRAGTLRDRRSWPRRAVRAGAPTWPGRGGTAGRGRRSRWGPEEWRGSRRQAGARTAVRGAAQQKRRDQHSEGSPHHRRERAGGHPVGQGPRAGPRWQPRSLRSVSGRPPRKMTGKRDDWGQD